MQHTIDANQNIDNHKSLKSKYDAVQLQKITDIFKSIAFPVRLSILEVLNQVEYMSVSELVEYTKIEASLLSHHLSKMKHSGVLESVREGRYIYYKLKLKNITSIFHCIDQCEIFHH